MTSSMRSESRRDGGRPWERLYVSVTHGGVSDSTDEAFDPTDQAARDVAQAAGLTFWPTTREAKGEFHDEESGDWKAESEE